MEVTPEFIAQSHPDKPERLYSLELSKQSIVKLCSLHLYPKLKSINLRSNLLESVEASAIERLKDLKEVDISCNSLISISGLSNPSMVKLNLSFNRIETLDSISKVLSIQNLQILQCEGNLISSTRPLSGLFSLKSLDLSSNLIESIEGLEQIQVLYN